MEEPSDSKWADNQTNQEEQMKLIFHIRSLTIKNKKNMDNIERINKMTVFKGRPAVKRIEKKKIKKVTVIGAGVMGGDIAAVAEIAHGHGVPLIVDNTVPSPYLCRPIEHGADIVVHALTKYMNGHGNSIGGIIVDSGKFPWAEHKARFKRLNEPDVSYHGVVYTEALGAAAFIGRARVVPLRNMGAALSPFNAWLTLQGIETLPLRMDRICDNTLALAQFLQTHPKVEWVRYAGLPDHADHAQVGVVDQVFHVRLGGDVAVAAHVKERVSKPERKPVQKPACPERTLQDGSAIRAKPLDDFLHRALLRLLRWQRSGPW